MLTTQQMLDLATTFLAAGFGLWAFRKMDAMYRLIFLQITLYLMVDLLAIQVNPNYWIYNLFMPVETALLMTAAQMYFKTRLSQSVLLFLFGMFILVYILDVINMLKLAYHAAIVEGLIFTGIYLIVLYIQFHRVVDFKNSLPIGCICIGMVLYFSATIPFLFVLNYFQDSPALNRDVFQSIVVNLASVRYFCIMIAFFLIGIKPFHATKHKTLT